MFSFTVVRCLCALFQFYVLNTVGIILLCSITMIRLKVLSVIDGMRSLRTSECLAKVLVKNTARNECLVRNTASDECLVRITATDKCLVRNTGTDECLVRITS